MNFVRLQTLSLINKISIELENHIGVNDRTLAEFIISLSEPCQTSKEFHEALVKNGAEFPTSFVDNMFLLITKMKPLSANVHKVPEVEISDSSPPRFSALSIPNQKIEIPSEVKAIPQIRSEGKRKHREILEPLLNHTYLAIVNSIKDFGFFAELDESLEGDIFGTKREGLCHISQISSQRINHPSDVVKRDERVWVKVIQMQDKKISLSMKEVDQETGQDISKRNHSIDNRSNPPVGSHQEDLPDPKKKKTMTPQEIWEFNQLVNAGVIEVQDHPNFDQNYGLQTNLDEIDISVERNEKEPNFLKGQTSKSGIHHEPTQLLKAPVGSLQRAAQQSSALAKDRRELRDKQKSLLVEKNSKDLKQSWQDPLSEPHERMIAQELRNLGDTSSDLPEWKKETIEKLSRFVPQKTTVSKSIQEVRKGLPVYKVRSDLLDAIKNNQVLVIIGETGSGKTTQMTQYLAESGYGDKKMIGCTQPRRVAAIQVAKRVAEEVGCKLGQDVGYSVRFDDCTSKSTKIKYMTDGMLLREALADGYLNNYSVIMLDEAHERSISTDVLFGLTKKILASRKDLKLIVTSATLDAERFSEYYDSAPIFHIKGRNFPVSVFYTKEPETDYLDASLVTILQIHLSEGPGDILLFLTGQEEIDTACQVLHERVKAMKNVPDLIILPIYSAMPAQMQSKIFEPTPEGSRKVVIATNIAETSITLDGIYYVVDPGFVKQNIYNPKTGMEQLVVVPISQAAAKQRTGRAGRTGPGKCYRLYTENAFKNEMLSSTMPEIQRTNLGNVVLTLKAMGINDLLGFEFMDPPPPQLLIAAMEELYALGALEDEGLLTKLGRRMAEFPLDPQLGKVVLASIDLGCSDEVLTIVSMLSVESVFYRPKDKAQMADEKKLLFNQSEGDHLTLLAVYQAWVRHDYDQRWCQDHFVQHRTLKKAQDIRKQLLMIMDRFKLPVVSCGKTHSKIRKAICSGFFVNAAKKDPQEGYKTLAEGQAVSIHPSSSLFNRNPEWVVYHTLILTTKEYMRDCVTIEPKWLVELAGNYFKFSDGKGKKKVERIKPLESKKK